MAELSVQCVCLDPLFNTPVKLFLCHVAKLESVLQSKVLFSYNGHPVTRVDVVGVITEVKRKEDALQCIVDDGTGAVSCFLPIHEGVDCSVETDLSQTLHQRFENPSRVNLGNLVHIVGALKRGLWSESIYITNCKWEVLKDRNQSDNTWLEHIQSQAKLYELFYNKNFNVDKKMKAAIKALLVREAEHFLRPKLQLLLEEFLFSETSTFPERFRGFELLEDSQIQLIITESCREIKPKFDANKTALNQHLRNQIGTRSLCGTLHFHITQGNLFKQKCYLHEAITKNEQMDATYFITNKCAKLLLAVEQAVKELEKSQTTVKSFQVLSKLNSPEFRFIKASQYAPHVMQVAMEYLIKHRKSL